MPGFRFDLSLVFIAFILTLGTYAGLRAFGIEDTAVLGAAVGAFAGGLLVSIKPGE